MSVSIWQIALVAILVVLLFGRGKISGLMGDVAQGIKSFKKGLADDDQTASLDRDTPEQASEAEEQKQKSSA